MEKRCANTDFVCSHARVDSEEKALSLAIGPFSIPFQLCKNPMTQSYAQIQKRIAPLQRTADGLREKEIAGVVSRIKVAIAHYGLTATQLGYGSSATRGAIPSAKARSSANGGAKYGDGKGLSWGGRGPRPSWLREAIASGMSLESFLVGAAPTGEVRTATGAATRASRKAKRKKRRPSSVIYRDDVGNSWTGRGPQPRWLKDALAGGKSLEDLKG